MKEGEGRFFVTQAPKFELSRFKLSVISPAPDSSRNLVASGIERSTPRGQAGRKAEVAFICHGNLFGVAFTQVPRKMTTRGGMGEI